MLSPRSVATQGKGQVSVPEVCSILCLFASSVFEWQLIHAGSSERFWTRQSLDKKISWVEKCGWKPHQRAVETLRVWVSGGRRGGKVSPGGSGEVGTGEPVELLVPALVLSFAFPTAKGWQRAYVVLNLPFASLFLQLSERRIMQIGIKQLRR